jgi:hypothetical protein
MSLSQIVYANGQTQAQEKTSLRSGRNSSTGFLRGFANLYTIIFHSELQCVLKGRSSPAPYIVFGMGDTCSKKIIYTEG